MRLFFSLVCFNLIFQQNVLSQIVLNEVAATNTGEIQDSFGDNPDWIEILNTSAAPVNLGGWTLTDNNTWNKWTMPDEQLAAGSRKMIFASGRNLPDPFLASSAIDHWETAVNETDTWEYFIGTNNPPANWKTQTGNGSGWPQGSGGFGYGDGDDNTLVPDGTISVYYRKVFAVTNVADLDSALLSMDYDDSFIAYLNGVEIFRNGISGDPQFDTSADLDHEATMYSGGNPEQFSLSSIDLSSLLNVGANVLAVEVHNISNTSSDLSGRTWLHFGISNSNNYFGPNPSWFNAESGFTSEWHANFGINVNETVKLYNPQGILVDNISASAQPGHARARIPDGLTWCYTDSPTPNAINTGTCYLGYSAIPNIVLASGFYATSQSTTITGTQVRYSTDGSVPRLLDPLYSAAINIPTTRVIRARSFEAGKLPSAVATKSYFINDPTTLPVVSVIANPGDLFNDGSGGPAVYDNAAGFQQSATTGCSIQYFDADHQLQFETPASLTPVGNFSLDFAQKSLQFQYDEEYGATGDILYNIFSKDKPGLGPSHGFRVRNMDDDAFSARMRDLVSNRMALTNEAGTAGYQNVVVFINGEYWGHYCAREMLNKYFMRDNYGANPENVNTIKTAFPGQDYVADDGTEADFFEMSDYVIESDMSVQQNFDVATTVINEKNWVDYFANEIYNDNQDWFPSSYFNNTRISNATADGIPWNYILWDVGYSQGFFGTDNNLLSNTLGYPAQQNRHTDMMNSLLENETYKIYFINRFADLLNWHWTTEKIHAIIDDCAAEVAPEMDRHNARFGGGDLADWQNDVNNLKYFHEVRQQAQRNHIEDYFGLNAQVDITLNVMPAGSGYVKISTVIPEEYPWSGIYFDGNPVMVTAIPNPGYVFQNWSANAFIAQLTNSTFTNNISTNTTFTANFIGAPIAANIKVTEINYHSDSSTDSGDWIEIYNSGTTSINLSDWTFRNSTVYGDYQIPTGTVLNSGAYLVIAENTILFSNEYPDVTNVVGPFSFDLNNGGDNISLTDLQENTIFNFSYDDTPQWPCTADGYGRTLELKTNNSNPSLAASWFDGCMGGSPGGPYQSCDPDIIISEINYKSATNANAGDWIELFNNTNNAIDLSGWLIGESTGNIFQIPQGLGLAQNSRIVIYQDNVLFSSQFPLVSNKTGPMIFGLNGDGDVIRISDSTGKLVMSVCYNDTAPWPLTPDGGGYTLEYNLNAANVNDGVNWFAGCPGGSPGTAYNANCSDCTNYGCTNNAACNYDAAADCDDGSCTFDGCTNALACNYNVLAGCDDGSCTLPDCTDAGACNYNPQALCSDNSCEYPGCNDPLACNYNPSAGCADNSCYYPGCTNIEACNFSVNAGCDDGSCVFPGCNDINACNYNLEAGCNDGSCTYNIYYPDVDGDSYGNGSAPGYYCNLPLNYVSNALDCNDGNALVFPGAAGTHEGLDNNCSGVLEEDEIYICLGDFDNNGYIGVSDMMIFIGEYSCIESCQTDVTFDNQVNIDDLLFLLNIYGSFCSE
jgi:CotH kinase protein/Lamin Tail Domain/Chitobiase/beta-hexosaminidase C-terminal domain/Divergent InlB B-repeat domain